MLFVCLFETSEGYKCLPFFLCQILDNYWPYKKKKKKKKQRSPRKLLCFSQISGKLTDFLLAVSRQRSFLFFWRRRGWGVYQVYQFYLTGMGWHSITMGTELNTGLLMAKFHTYKGKQHFYLPVGDEPNYAHSCVTHGATPTTVWLTASFPSVLYHADETC